MTSAALAGPVHAFVPGTGADLPPLLLFHKTGGDQHELLPLAHEVAPRRAAIGLRGSVDEAGRLRFFRRLSPGVFDEDDLRRRTAREVGCLLAARALPRPVALGVSNGANMAAALLLHHRDLLAGAVLVRPAPPFARLPDADLAGASVLVIAGVCDATVPRTETDRLDWHLRAAGAEVSRHDIEAGHGPVEADAVLIRTWLAALTPGATA